MKLRNFYKEKIMSILNKELDTRNDDTLNIIEKNMLRALFYAPSSPVSATKAAQIESWYLKLKKSNKFNSAKGE